MTRRRFLLGVILTGSFVTRARPARGQEPRTRPAEAGTVTGTALGIGSSAASPPSPLAGLVVVLVPRSDALLDSLERVKRRSRDSVTAYRTAIPEMRQLVETFLQSARSSGDVQVVPRASVDEAGRFVLDEVPAGSWILLGRRAVYVDRAFKDKRKETGTYQAQPRLIGYERVMVWLQAVTVEPGHGQSVELTDRNMWFEGVEEKTTVRGRTGTTPSRRSAH
jgi:hypothetical protein